MDKLNFQSLLVHLAIAMAGMMIVYRVDFLKKLILGGK